ncbi:MAG: M48 family metallopeptidase, partial [Bacteroidetes bacterium]|nr:M48 family metallopeptidase [Bacteroidota bacterium]
EIKHFKELIQNNQSLTVDDKKKFSRTLKDISDIYTDYEQESEEELTEAEMGQRVYRNLASLGISSATTAHEIGHVEHRHVVTKLIKEFGLTLLFSVLTGGDAVVLSEIGKTTISTVFDRKQEKEADLYALDMLTKSNISPQSLAAFFRRLKREKGSYNENLEIFMTHPHVNSRIKSSIEYKVPEDFESIDFDIDWEKVKKSIGYDS